MHSEKRRDTEDSGSRYETATEYWVAKEVEVGCLIFTFMAAVTVGGSDDG